MITFTRTDNSIFSLVVSSWPTGATIKIFNGSVDVTTSFTIPTITAPGTYTIQAKDGKFVGTESLNLTAQMSSTGNATESSTPALTSPIDTTAPAAPKITQGTTGSLKNQIFFTVTESNLSTKIYNDANDITSQFLISNSGLNYTLTAKTASFNGTESLNLSVKLSDAIGNVSVASNVLKTTLDTTPPASPSIGVLSVTKVNQPVFNGTTELGAVVNAYQNNILIGTATADKITGAFSITPTSYIAIGNQNFNIKSIDGFGNISQSSTVETSIGGVGYNQSYSLNDSSKNYTLSYRQNVSQLTDHNDGSEFNIINFNKIIFNDATIDLTIFEKASTIKMSQFEDLATIYVGYFNRAPDAEGLAYWASRLADGMSLKDISKSFFYQPETGVKYSSNLSVSDFVQNTYNYLLGRAPDTNGFNYWVNQINNKVVDRDSFVLTMINGARAATGSATDVQYLSNKADISYNFAITNGLNNVEWASDILSKVTDSLSSVSDANSQIESYADIASSADSGEFVIKLLGILP